MNDLDPIGVSKPRLKMKKLKGNDIKWSNLGKNQTTHFVGYTEFFYYNCKINGSTCNVGPTLYVSSVNEGKTQIRWVPD